MRSGRAIAGVIFVALLAAAAPSPAAPRRPALSALDSLQPGMWRLRMLGGSTEAPRELCISDMRMLMQLHHGNAACAMFVIANEARRSTLQYSCPGKGWGRTSVRLDTATVVQIDTQGIAANAPFAFVAEARRIGDCPATPAATAPKPATAPTPAPAPGGR